MYSPFDGSLRRRIYLMRHGDVAYFDAEGRRVADSRLVVLTEQGQREAIAMRELLAEVPFDHAINSGLPRTVETGSIVLGGRTLQMRQIPELEEIRGGSPDQRAQMTPPEYAYAMFQTAEPGATYARGEAINAFYDRVTGAYRRILADMSWRTLLIAAHGGVNRAILCGTLGSGPRYFGAFEQDTGCLNVIDIDTSAEDGRVLRQIIRAINVTPADPAKTKRLHTTMESLALKAFPALQSKI